MKDVVGKILKVNDNIVAVYNACGGLNFVKGKVVGFTDKKVKYLDDKNIVSYKNCNQIIKV